MSVSSVRAAGRPALLRRGRRAPRRRAVVLLGLLPLAASLALWQLLGSTHSPYAPPPSTWWGAVRSLQDAGTLLPALRETVETFALALVVATIVGAALGLAIGTSWRVRRATGPLLELCRTMPPPAMVPVAALLLGLGRSMAVVVVVLTAIWPIVLNTVAAVEALHPLLLDMAHTLRLPAHQRVAKVLAPALVPSALLGVRVATPVCVIVTLLVEMLTGAPGVGSLLLAAERNFQSAQTFGLLVVVGAFGVLVNVLVGLVESRVMRRWPPRVTAR